MMPAEVTAYFLKHQDLRLRLEFQIVCQCAPFLKGKPDRIGRRSVFGNPGVF